MDWLDREAVAALLPEFSEYVTYQAGFGYGYEIPVPNVGEIVVQASADGGEEVWAGFYPFVSEEVWAGFYPFVSEEATTYARGPVSDVADVFGDVWAAVVNGEG